MGHGHHDSPKVVIPDYRIYKVEDVPELVALQQRLAKKGLKDPWLRNDVWRYQKQFGTPMSRVKAMFGNGFKIGISAFFITLAIEKVVDVMNPDPHGHGHH